MNIEFHYYITRLIAARAGLGGEDLRKLSYSSQYTDDNKKEYKVKGPKRGQHAFRGRYYHNLISQTMDIFKPQNDKLKIYPLFHFIPGDPEHPDARRVDGRVRPFNTTPNSIIANRIIDEAIATENMYMIGMASHAYVDTWAHQNFVGYKDPFNGMTGVLNTILPDIGHADARHNPDWPALVWEDERLINSTIDNRIRFFDAAEHLFRKLRLLCDSSASEASTDQDVRALRADLDSAIGDRDDANLLKTDRIDRYKNLATQTEYEGSELPEYHESEWFDFAVKTVRRASNHRNVGSRQRISYLFRGGFESSDWFSFQESVKIYVDIATGVLKESLDFSVDTDLKKLEAGYQ